MRVKYLRTADLGGLESLVNGWLSKGWELYHDPIILPNNDYFVTLHKQTAPPLFHETQEQEVPPSLILRT